MKRLIDADKFIEYCRNGLKDLSAVPYYKDNIKAMTEVTKGFIQDIEDQPSVDVEPVVHAHWMTTCDTSKKCSNCGYDFMPTNSQHYCPCCGAKMDELLERTK